MGVDVCFDVVGFDIGIWFSWEQVMEDVCKCGGKLFLILVGCFEYLFGGLGFVGFVEEVCQQEVELGFKFDYIVVCLVMGSMQVGMVVGFVVDGWVDKVIGIDVLVKLEQMCVQIFCIVQYIVELVDFGCDIIEKDVVFDMCYGGLEYGLFNEGMFEVICLCVCQEVMFIDLVYEGKFMYGMIDMVCNGEFFEGLCVFYVYLGGVLVFNVYSFIFCNG